MTYKSTKNMQTVRSEDNLPCTMGTGDGVTPKCHGGSELYGRLQMASDCLSSHFKQQWEGVACSIGLITKYDDLFKFLLTQL